MNAKSIFYILAGMAGIILTSYTSIYAYNYITTTTLEDVQRKILISEKAKSEVKAYSNEYCHDNRLEGKECEITLKKLYEDTTKTQAEGNENDTSSGKQVSRDRNSGSGEVRCPELYYSGKTILSPRIDGTYKFSEKEVQELYPNCIIGTHSTGSTVPPSKTVEEAKEKFSHAKLYQDVCKKQINSPLCKDRKLFDRLYQLTEERLPGKNFYPILLGITNAESSLGLNFAKDKVGGTCAGRNNWGGIKWKKTDDGKSVKDQQIPDQFGCYLYKFDSIEDYWISKVNTIRYGYAGCIDSPTPVRCLSFSYVGDKNVAEQSWINNVSVFLN